MQSFSSVAHSCLTLCNPMDRSIPGFPVHHQLLELAQTHVHQVGMPSNISILCHRFLLLPSILPSIRVFSNESVLHIRWPKYWRFSFSISLSNEYSGLISFWIDWFDLLEVQGTLKNLLQHHNSKASIFCAQPSLWSNSHIQTWLLEKSSGFPGGASGKEPTCQCRRHNETWVQSLGWEDSLEEGLATPPVFLHEESDGQRSLEGYSP